MFAALQLFVDPIPRDPAINMAIDEALLALPFATLRFYGWNAKSISLGYFTPVDSVRHLVEWDLVRRWTGGGIVYHDGLEITYALAAPPDHPVAKLRSADLYCGIHRALLRALAEIGVAGSLAQPSRRSTANSACFTKPVADDVLDAGGLKLAGAAQRRGRSGFLQQGSIRIEPRAKTIEELSQRFAAHLSEQVLVTEPPLDSVRVNDLAGKYRSPEWLRRF